MVWGFASYFGYWDPWGEMCVEIGTWKGSCWTWDGRYQYEYVCVYNHPGVDGIRSVNERH